MLQKIIDAIMYLCVFGMVLTDIFCYEETSGRITIILLAIGSIITYNVSDHLKEKNAEEF